MTSAGPRFLQAYPDVFDGGDHALGARYFVEDYREHNPFIDDGVAASIDHQKRVGGYRCRMLAWCQDDGFVFVHAQYRLGRSGFEVVDVYRLDGSGRATEHWDTVQPCELSDDWSERPVMVDAPPDEQQVTRGQVLALYDGPLRRRDEAALAEMLHATYEGSPGAGGMFGALPDRMAQDWAVDEVRLVGVQGDLAVVYYRAVLDGAGWWVADVLRYSEGLVVHSATVAGHQHAH